MPSKTVLRLVFVLLVGMLILASGIFLYSRSHSLDISGNNIELISNVEGKKLIFKNTSVLNSILEEQGTFTNGIFDSITQTTVKPEKIIIIFSSVLQPDLRTTWQSEKDLIVAQSGHYEYDKNTKNMTITIYLNPDYYNAEGFLDYGLDYQLIAHLVSANPTRGLKDGESVFDRTRAIWDKYIGKDLTKYPIDVI